MDQIYFAHSTDSRNKSDWQLLKDHLGQVAMAAAARGHKFRGGRLAHLTGLLHDLGKYTLGFQRRLEGGPSVDHATAGARVALEAAEAHRQMGYHFDALALELAAYAIAGHHAGLPDLDGGDASLRKRVQADKAMLDGRWEREVPFDAIGLMPEWCWRKDGAGPGFQAAMLGRMVFSCLVDADFRDTEAFYVARGGAVPDRTWPDLKAIMADLIARLDAHMALKLQKTPDTPVNRLRADILAHVRARASAVPGVFTLTVPTGGGKTLASLAFALDHTRAHGLDRIVFAIPFTSIIDQTAKIYRDILGEDVVLEHHSALEVGARQEEESSTGGAVNDRKLRLAMEDWAAPIVVTTNVQLFESLFSHRPSRCRKLHNLARSVIVLDEAQAIPRNLLKPCVAALDELARNYGCTIVLCTATQPALRRIDRFAGGFDIGPERELAPDPDAFAQHLRRVTLRRAGVLDDGAMIKALQGAPQGLVIVNTRGHALALYRAAKVAGLNGLVHLTTRQCAAHRRIILDEIRVRLKRRAPCRVIATSLVEAGVDLDFPRVWRAEAGLEQVHQAAGRCNREGLRLVEDSVVTVFKPSQVAPPREVAKLAAAMARVADRHHDLLSPEALLDYFQEVYWCEGDGLDRVGTEGRTSVLKSFSCDASGTSFDYRRVGEDFRLIESGLAPVIIPYDEVARAALWDLASSTASVGAIARKLQPYLVQVPPDARALMLKLGYAEPVNEHRLGDQFVQVLKHYDRELGLLWEDASEMKLEGFIF
jgi:CRISPR-associated endonuclease/helicase Cas3